MTSDRCPSCNAAVPAGAEWCTLCYAVLRAPERVTVPAPVPVPAIAEYGASSVDIARLAPDPILDAPVAVAAPVARAKPAGWPCLGCGAVNSMDDDTCSGCARPFLPTDTAPSIALPVVGDLGRLDRAQRIAVTIIAAVLAMGAFIALAFIGGSVL